MGFILFRFHHLTMVHPEMSNHPTKTPPAMQFAKMDLSYSKKELNATPSQHLASAKPAIICDSLGNVSASMYNTSMCRPYQPTALSKRELGIIRGPRSGSKRCAG